MTSKRKHSSLWMHFVEEEHSKRAKCNYCLALISIVGGSNGNLIRHMKKKHPTIPIVQMATIESQPQIITDAEPLQSTQTTSEFESIISASNIVIVDSPQTMSKHIRKPPRARKFEQIDRQVLKMIAKGYHALQIVEEPEFSKLIELVSQCPGYQLPSIAKLSENLLPTVHNDVTDDVKKKLEAVSAVSLTIDGWTSSNNNSYIDVVAHFIEEDSKLQSALLDCINYNEQHTSQNLCDFIKDVMADWQISHKVTAVISDNDPNLQSAIKLGEWQSISCFAHSLNLIVQEATKEISDVLARVRKIVEFFKRSTQGKNMLIATQQQMNLLVLDLKKDVQTRWTTTFDMLQRIVQIKNAVIAAVALLRSDLTLDEKDWEIIKGVLPLLSPFYEITEAISTEKNMSLSKVIIFCNLLNSFLQKHVAINEKIVAVQSVLMKGLEYRFKDIENNILYAECTVLDPRFRTKAFRNQLACDIAVQSLRNKISRVQIVQQRESNSSEIISIVSYSSPSSYIKQDSIWDEYDHEISKTAKPDNQLAAGIRELDKYLSEEYLDRKEDPLHWWHERRQLYPHIYSYMLQRFCIVATSVPCERVFSATGQILNERRSLLSASKVSKLIFLHNNM